MSEIPNTYAQKISELDARLEAAEKVCFLVECALTGPDEQFCGPDFPELRELHAAWPAWRELGLEKAPAAASGGRGEGSAG